ncbi:acyltransferase [Mycobacterium intracellulare subsp. chimaera]|uniref:acyltransferase family protein n=1 Tax=Mycobacterium intracellulare TaxID=1767 RepID=UPI00044B3E71|nr:acyltransferase [Mycobacterium intracellulare]ASL10140.1 acyltransferase [Mycobacterium intracellulare subsp. chimaera]ASL22041.1 acyltransferase [Mycobacterium intracellulare subsp. chimaera]ETZ28242.1 acyltransferase family protein [Mycobacterium intracellulare MIN_052511_1280]MCV7325511.1 acyltransferase [Mycobacterium intracellulare subsp. chimaera]MDM3907746.1 acyltransferase [Mycobacterium intracellulare subsp. chimaera]
MSATVSGADATVASGRQRRWSGGPTLAQAFDTRSNALNAWRLVLASGVILQHSWPLTGRKIYPPIEQLLTQVWVDGFFAISGFLITASWVRNPRLRDYFVARILRIFPGLWVCLAVVAFVIAPISVAVQGGSPAKLLLSPAPFQYVLNNAVLNIYFEGIDGTPRDVPLPGVWDGVLWTLIFELFCYVAVAVAGTAKLLNRRWPAPVVFALFLAASALVSYPIGTVPTFLQMITRFALVFAAGGLLHQYQDMVPARWSLVAVSAAVVVLAGLLVPNYRIIAAIPLAYAVVVSGALIHSQRLRLRTDLSYGVYIYAWPMQQLLVICGLGFLHPLAFTALAGIATLPLAALSWFLVETRALALKSRFKRRPRDRRYRR